MLYGIDISHHNFDQISEGTLDITRADFVIMKATEGKTYTDPKLNYNFVKCGIDQLKGFYHYARPDRNGPKDEAYNFIGRVGAQAGRVLYALDVEGKSFLLENDDLADWCLTWIRTVKRETGVLPLVYMGTEGCIKIGQKLLNENVGLWFARYRDKLKKEMYSPWPFWAIWQYSSNPWDQNRFNGTRDQFLKYCAQEK